MFTLLSKRSAWGTAPHNSTLTPHLLHSTKQPSLCHISDSAHCGLMGVDSLSSRTVSQLSIQVSNAVRVRIVCWGCGRCPLLCLRTIWADVFVVSLEGEQTDSKFIKALKKPLCCGNLFLIWNMKPRPEIKAASQISTSLKPPILLRCVSACPDHHSQLGVMALRWQLGAELRSPEPNATWPHAFIALIKHTIWQRSD